MQNMHTYNTSSTFGHKLIYVLAVASISISTILVFLCSWIQNALGLSLGGLSAMAVFGLLFFTFDKWLWRVGFLRRFLLVPDLNGCWQVEGKSVMREGEQVDYEWSGEVKIVQSWSRISIILKTGQSSSRSVTASIYRREGEGYQLMFQYENKPQADQVELERHAGGCELVFSEELAKAEGEYFTNISRQTAGTMKLQRTEAST